MWLDVKELDARKADIKALALPLLGVTLLGVLLRLYGISSQPPLHDEVSAAFSAVQYMENGQFGPTMWYHPNLRNIVLYALGEAFGYGPYAMRGFSLLAGILSIPVVGLILYALTGNRAASVLASFFLSIEQVHITFSRQAIQETWTTFFFLLGVLLAVLYYKKDTPLLLIFSGIAFGLGISSKFHAFFPLLVSLGAGLYLSFKARSASRCVFVLSCLVFIPAAVYILTFLPWFGRGYGLIEWIGMQKTLLTKMMTHRGNPMDQVIDIRAWQWFLRPMGYANFTYSGGAPHVTVAFSSPVVWLLVLPSVAALTWRLREKSREGKEGIAFLLMLFLVSYLPLAASPRPIWLLSSLAVLPFALMAVALEAARWGRKALAGYIVLALLSSLALYPMSMGKAKSYAYLDGIVERFKPPHP